MTPVASKSAIEALKQSLFPLDLERFARAECHFRDTGSYYPSRDRVARGFKEGAYPFIPLDPAVFVRSLARAIPMYSRQRFHFLDIGCGFGTKLVLAEHLGFEAYGIEYNHAYVQAGRKLLKGFGLPPMRIIEADALAFEAYDEFDVLYFYSPFQDRALEFQLERRVFEDMKPGAQLIPELMATQKLPQYMHRSADGVHNLLYKSWGQVWHEDPELLA